MSKDLKFVPSQTKDEIKDVYNFNTEAFTELKEWSQQSIEGQIKAGWQLVSVKSGEEIICALFIKKNGPSLLTKNTPIKINHQGNGYSHAIKDFYETYAKENGLSEVYNYTPRDNFRMISLNEGHDYSKTGKSLDDGALIEWIKKI